MNARADLSPEAGAQTLAEPAPRRPQAKIPRATYRVQLHGEFRFDDATALVPYLAALGISHLYCSPFLKARAGSRHGYDIVDHNALNPEIGDRRDLDRLVAALHAHGMGLLIDIVPNHMGVLGGDNAWWLDVLEHGPASLYAEYFEIDWTIADPVLTGKVLLPILGAQYGIALERGQIRLAFDAGGGRFELIYYAHRLPIDPLCYAALLRRALGLPADDDADAAAPTAAKSAGALPEAALRAGAQREVAIRSGAHAEVLSLAERFERLPARDSGDAMCAVHRHRDAALLKERLAELVARFPRLARALDEAVREINGTVGDRASFDALDALIGSQAYRLAQWRVAGDEINYRRFFDVNDLAALRMERPQVFDATHRLVLSLVTSGAVDGLRIDHPDGLADPAGYFRRLQQSHADLMSDPAAIASAPAAGSASDSASASASASADKPLYIVIEKIAAAHEYLPADWAVHGTTGYRFANLVNGLMIDGGARRRLDRAWRAFVRDEAREFDELSWQCRRIVMDGALAGQLNVLAAAALRLAREDRRTRDFTFTSLRNALADVVAAFPVYRTYIVETAGAQDRRYIDWAIGRARRRSTAADGSVFDFLRSVLLARPPADATAQHAARYRALAVRLQQFTAPVAAKGIEDTALYRHQRLISVNDVGGEPDTVGHSVAAFHAASRDRAAHWPHTMVATSTHDTKRSEDVRARIDVISELPALWRLSVRRWSRMNRRHKRIVDGRPAPSRNDEYLLYQTLIGSLPTPQHAAIDSVVPDAAQIDAYARRIGEVMLKSVREAKLNTSWLNPNPAYEQAVTGFVAALLDPRESNLFLGDLSAVGARFAWYGALNGISIATLKCLSPGVPDIYQGHETIALSLVDPDNRRAVDYAARRQMLARSDEIAALPDRAAALRALLTHATDGMAKFWAVRNALDLRAAHETMLAGADYLPLQARGEKAAHAVAFARRRGRSFVIVVATRLYATLQPALGELPVAAVWGDTTVDAPLTEEGTPLPAGTVARDAISGSVHRLDAAGLPLALVLRDFPVAALECTLPT